jgi:CheY-like chemotaxis protein
VITANEPVEARISALPSMTPPDAMPPRDSMIVARQEGDGQGPKEAARPRATILLVDDQAPVLRATKRLLERDGFRVLDASSGAAALELLALHGSAIELLLSDIVMPEMTGLMLASKVRERAPGLPIVYVSGHFDDPEVRREIERGEARLLGKPFSRTGLQAIIEEALDDAASLRAGGSVSGPPTTPAIPQDHERSPLHGTSGGLPKDPSRWP